MQSSGPNLQFAFPNPEGWQRNLLIALFGLFVVELLLPYAGIDKSFLTWHSLDGGPLGTFEWWQLLTRFLVHASAQPAIFPVLISLVVLYFFLPATGEVLNWDSVGQAVVSAAVVGTLLPFGMDAAGLLDGQATGGWESLALVFPILFGIARPEREIILFVFPAPAKILVWGSLAIASLSLLMQQSLGTAEMMGVWLGTFGWWHLLGPGRRQRDLRRRGASIERELRLTVLEGGRTNDGDNRDDTVH